MPNKIIPWYDLIGAYTQPPSRYLVTSNTALIPARNPPPRQFRHAVPELFTDLYVFGVLGGAPVHLKWRGDLSRLKKTCFGHIAQPGGASGGTVPLDALPSVKPEGRAVPEPGFQASSAV